MPPQATISSIVRRQPSHQPVRGSILHTSVQGLGTVELAIAVLVLFNPLSRRAGLIGGLLSFLTPVVTLSFLISTPEAWVPALGDAQHGFPYLSGMGRLIWKDTIMMAGAVGVMADSARSILDERAVDMLLGRRSAP